MISVLQWKWNLKQVLVAIFLPTLCAFMLTAAHAQLAYDFTLNTTTLAGLSGTHNYTLDFQFNDGSLSGGDGNNSALISGFDFGGGSVIGAPTLTGGATGDLNAAVSLNDSSFLNEFTQGFTPGSRLTLTFILNPNVGVDEDPATGGTPDSFSLAILDNGAEISADPSGALLSADISTSTPTIHAFNARSQYGNLSPLLTPHFSAVPEPGSWTLALGLAGLGASFLFGRPRNRKGRIGA